MIKTEDDNQIMTQKEIFLMMHRDDVIAMANDLEWSIKPYDEDPYWKYEVRYTYAGREVWVDHWHIKPDDVQIYNAALSGLKDGSFGDQMVEELWEKEQAHRKKYKLKDDKGRLKKLGEF